MREVLLKLISIYPADKVKTEILPELKSLIEADGIVMSSESELMQSIDLIMQDIQE